MERHFPRAVTALGDTLFPAGSLVEGLQADLSATSNLLIRLRVIHPALAVMGGVYVIASAWVLKARSPRARTLAWTLVGLVVGQWVAGAVNILLLAPVWMQLVHLLVADAVWVTFVFFWAELLANDARPGVSSVAV